MWPALHAQTGDRILCSRGGPLWVVGAASPLRGCSKDFATFRRGVGSSLLVNMGTEPVIPKARYYCTQIGGHRFLNRVSQVRFLPGAPL